MLMGMGDANCQVLYFATWRICYPLVRLLFSTAVVLVVPLVFPPL